MQLRLTTDGPCSKLVGNLFLEFVFCDMGPIFITNNDLCINSIHGNVARMWQELIFQNMGTQAGACKSLERLFLYDDFWE